MPSPASGPQERGHDTTAAGSALLEDFSLDMTGKIGEVAPARAVIPPGTQVHVGFTSGQDPAGRASTALVIKRSGFVPVPVIAARRLRSEAMLRRYLDALLAADASGSVLVLAGDPAQPQGPYPDAASVIGSGLLEQYGVRQVSVAGHPGGHPPADDKALWSALAGKAAALEQRGLDGSVVTQFGFDPGLVLAWLAGARARGVSLPVRVGVPGPAGVRLLLSYASRCGVSVSTPIARDSGLSLTGPAATGPAAATATPDKFIRALASGYDPQVHGEVKLHLNPFGGFTATAEWASRFRGSKSREVPAIHEAFSRYLAPAFRHVRSQSPARVRTRDDALRDGLNCVALAHLVIRDLFGYALPARLQAVELTRDLAHFEVVPDLVGVVDVGHRGQHG